MWDRRLAALAGEYRSGVLSWVAPSGDPVSVRVTAVLDGESERVRFPGLPAMVRGSRGPACLLFHQHDERLEGLRQVALRGELVAEGDDVALAVSAFVTANGRSGTDRMPHAGAPLHMLQFYRLGRGKAKEYLAKRGAPWPPIPFEEIARAVDDVSD